MRLNISSKIILLLSVTIVFVLSIGFYLITLKESEERFNEMRKDALAISRTIQVSAGKIMSDLQSDRDYIQTLTEHLGNIGGVEWVEVFDQEATIIAHTDNERIGGKPMETHESYVKEIFKNGKPIEEEDKQRSRYNRFVPVYDITREGKEAVIGVVEVVLDMKLVFKKVATLRLRMILTVIVLIMALLGLNLWFLRKIVVLPIRKLLDMTKKVAKGNLTQRLKITSHDEFGKLGTSFNKMVEDLEATTTSIENLNKEITERKYAEERTKSIAYILEDSLNEIYIFDAKTLRFIQVNKGGRLNLGYSVEELSSLTPLDLKPEFTVESFAKMVEPLRTGEKKRIQFMTVHRRKDGSLYDVEVHLQLSTFQSSPVFVAIILDITERKKMEETLFRQRN